MEMKSVRIWPEKKRFNQKEEWENLQKCAGRTGVDPPYKCAVCIDDQQAENHADETEHRRNDIENECSP